MCLNLNLSLLFCEKSFLHWLHCYGVSPECVGMWLLRWPLLWKHCHIDYSFSRGCIFEYPVSLYESSPQSVLKCSLSLSFCEKILSPLVAWLWCFPSVCHHVTFYIALCYHKKCITSHRGEIPNKHSSQLSIYILAYCQNNINEFRYWYNHKPFANRT